MAAWRRISSARQLTSCLRLVLFTSRVTAAVLLLTSVPSPAAAVRLPAASCHGDTVRDCDSESAVLACTSRDARDDSQIPFAAAYPACYCTAGLPRHCSDVCDRSDDLSECTLLCPDYARACRTGWTPSSAPGRAVVTVIVIALIILAVVGVMVAYGAVQWWRHAKGGGKEDTRASDKKVAENVKKPSSDFAHVLITAPGFSFKTPF